MFSFEFWKKHWKGGLITVIVFAGIMAVWWFTMLSESSDGGYTAMADELSKQVEKYQEYQNGNLPISGANFTLAKPAGEYFIIDICMLVPYRGADGCAAVEGENNDNCDAGTCQCNASSHYIWGVDSYGTIVSKCVGAECKSTDSDGYQGIWP